MIGKINVEPAILSNFIFKYQQLKVASSANNSDNNNNNNSNSAEFFSPGTGSSSSPNGKFIVRTKAEKTINNTQLALKDLRKLTQDTDTMSNMFANAKFKSVLLNLWQQNSYSTQKSIKPQSVDYHHPTTSSSSNSNTDDSSSNSGSSSHDYRRRREKNNESVRKSRAKNRSKIQECAEQVNELRKENGALNKTLGSLEGELFTLKNLFQHCFSFNLSGQGINPSAIPTSTLYKMIMKTDVPVVGTAPSLSEQIMKADSASKQVALPSISENNANLSETDQFYINQLKNALSNYVKVETKSSPASSPSYTPPATPPHQQEIDIPKTIQMKELDYITMANSQQLSIKSAAR